MLFLLETLAEHEHKHEDNENENQIELKKNGQITILPNKRAKFINQFKSDF